MTQYFLHADIWTSLDWTFAGPASFLFVLSPAFILKTALFLLLLWAPKNKKQEPCESWFKLSLHWAQDDKDDMLQHEVGA